jgi:hypothetical protein
MKLSRFAAKVKRDIQKELREARRELKCVYVGIMAKDHEITMLKAQLEGCRQEIYRIKHRCADVVLDGHAMPYRSR